MKSPVAFHLMVKPTGAICNLDCRYCFFLGKAELYPGSSFRMNEATLEEYICQYLDAQQVPAATIAWQGGEPTLMGLDFFRHSIELVEKHRRPGMIVDYTIQTNGILLDDVWCEFLGSNRFLVGLSIDGPRALHDRYRVDKAGQPTFDRVMQAARLLQKHQVDFNVLCAVHAANAGRPLDVYRFFHDDLGIHWIQFIPIVERINQNGATLRQEGDRVTSRSVLPEDWGEFLIAIFDEWVRNDVGKTFINQFEAGLAAWAGTPPALCIFDRTCGKALALEHNGDLYACDHFVEPVYLLGNILEKPMKELAASTRQHDFGQDKSQRLPRFCRACDFLWACYGECPKNRFRLTPDGERGLNYLCPGYRSFFRHIDGPMRTMAALYRSGRSPTEVMSILPQMEARWKEACLDSGRNDPCPCGSGKKVKHCHGRPTDSGRVVP
ncbi:MAG: anaerobic sulfatase maturase [Coprothermobacterota bacterium]|nr:anaerobic sulfatase maturase [Coprothermobacterota bacterium]